MTQVSLRDFARVITKGTTPTTIGHAFSEVGVPFLRAEDIVGASVDLARVGKRITPECHQTLRRSTIESGDILVTIAGTVGRIGVMPTTNETANCNQAVAIVKLMPGRFEPDYLLYELRSPRIQGQLRQQGTTATITNVSLAQIGDLRVTCPPKSEQRRIVDLLSRAENIVRMRKEAEAKAKEIIPALFLDMFGDPGSNPKGWVESEFQAIGTLDRGRSRHRPRDAAHLYGGSYPFVQTGDVTNSGGAITNYSQTYSEAGLAQSRLWSAGTLCITIAANIAETGVLTFDACFPDSVVGFLPGKAVRTEYIQEWLGFLQPTLAAQAPQAAQKNINLAILRNLKVPLPPLELQTSFAAHTERIRAVAASQKAATVQSDLAFQSLLAGVFGDGR